MSEQVLSAVAGPVRPLPRARHAARHAVSAIGGDVDHLLADDVQLTLTVPYELHHQGVDGVDDRWEWSPDLIAARSVLEDAVERALRVAVTGRARPPQDAADVPEALFRLAADDDGPSLANHVARSATREQFREFLVHRSLYHLKQADPHTWAIPRLSGRAKAGLVEIQADEYGSGRAERMHAVLFATAMRGAGLDDGYGTYLDALPAVTLAWANSFMLLGLHRRLRGAVAGHLTAPLAVPA